MVNGLIIIYPIVGMLLLFFVEYIWEIVNIDKDKYFIKIELVHCI